MVQIMGWPQVCYAYKGSGRGIQRE